MKKPTAKGMSDMIRNVINRIRYGRIPDDPPLEDFVRVLIARAHGLIDAIYLEHGVKGRFSAEVTALLGIVNATEQMLPQEDDQ
jgi:hypothetical protein